MLHLLDKRSTNELPLLRAFRVFGQKPKVCDGSGDDDQCEYEE
jgi:hypothetical protein